MKIVFILVTFSILLFAKDLKDEFMDMCLHPNTTQRVTFEAIAKSLNIKHNEKGCKKIQFFYFKSSKKKRPRDSMILTSTNITDLSVLIFFPNIKELSLNRNKIKDISILKKLSKLEKLDISNNPITNISVLASLKKLKVLSMSNVPANIDVLKDNTNIYDLHISINNRDISVVKNFKKLKSIMLIRNEIADICVFKDLINLERIYAGHTNTKDISCLNKLTKIKRLIINDNPIKDISVVKNFKDLIDLDISDTKVEDITVLKYNQKLKIIYMDNTNVTDASVLTGKRLGFNVENTPLVRCSPSTYEELLAGKSCYEKDGTLKPWWKRWFF